MLREIFLSKCWNTIIFTEGCNNEDIQSAVFQSNLYYCDAAADLHLQQGSHSFAQETQNYRNSTTLKPKTTFNLLHCSLTYRAELTACVEEQKVMALFALLGSNQKLVGFPSISAHSSFPKQK